LEILKQVDRDYLIVIIIIMKHLDYLIQIIRILKDQDYLIQKIKNYTEVKIHKNKNRLVYLIIMIKMKQEIYLIIHKNKI